jgi:hypothetical protein
LLIALQAHKKALASEIQVKTQEAEQRRQVTASGLNALYRTSFILLSVIEQAQSKGHVIIQPTTLVLDTNCFLDHLAEIERLLAYRLFVVVVPLIGSHNVRC